VRDVIDQRRVSGAIAQFLVATSHLIWIMARPAEGRERSKNAECRSK